MRACVSYLILVLLFTATVIGLSQSEHEPYFSLASFRTYESNGKPTISLSAWNAGFARAAAKARRAQGEVFTAPRQMDAAFERPSGIIGLDDALNGSNVAIRGRRSWCKRVSSAD